MFSYNKVKEDKVTLQLRVSHNLIEALNTIKQIHNFDTTVKSLTYAINHVIKYEVVIPNQISSMNPEDIPDIKDNSKENLKNKEKFVADSLDTIRGRANNGEVV